MCCEQLICARCSGRVAEARCATCRATRAALHHDRGDRSTLTVPILVGVLVVLYLVLTLYLRTT
ncbi:MAG TPA: hypothetical protein VIR27_22120 [Mycobacteriales bacterium]